LSQLNFCATIIILAIFEKKLLSQANFNLLQEWMKQTFHMLQHNMES